MTRLMTQMGPSLLAATLMVLVLNAPATATPTLIAYDPSYDPNSPEAEWLAYIPPIYRFGASSSYDAGADIFTLTAFAADPFFESSTFFLIAGVDEAGQLLGGTAIWLGGIPSLGVPTGTTLLTGDVIAVEYGFFNGVSPGIDFVIDVESSLSALGLGPTVGYSNAVIPWSLPGSPPVLPEPWSTSFVGLGGYTWDALLNVRPVPHAPTLVLFLASIGFCLGLVPLASRTRRWSRAHRERRADWQRTVAPRG